jgi:hypothetical protein
MRKILLVAVFSMLVLSFSAIAFADENTAIPVAPTPYQSQVVQPVVTTTVYAPIVDINTGAPQSVSNSVYGAREGYITAITDTSIEIKAFKGQKAGKLVFDKLNYTFDANTKLVRNVLGKITPIKSTELKVGRFVRVECNKSSNYAVRIALRPVDAAKEKVKIDQQKLKIDQQNIKAQERKLKVEKAKANKNLKKIKQNAKKEAKKEAKKNNK